jgi:hypothetical protein
MTANDRLERRVADYYAAEAPPRAPDWLLRSTLETIDANHSGASSSACRGGPRT